ncbi:hypothetical protein P691DRAFT_739662 [Macrolepiota fuliginosa MF-IS2]|uniref:CENP-V/GFA domain-containing protein n=1 Tax=Macrolepiota fuliginosa MF-IS2 TaxID=1400762 RepID=A0A9P6BW58_9AGAR|nr:hypothetical protein P691DRAFT_739662 [Macrolepiota fuliginosa MF-IS2]
MADNPTNPKPSQAASFHASCFCGKASFEVEGKPLFSLYCHCTRCQRIHGSPFVHILHYNSKALTWNHTDPNALLAKSHPHTEWKEWRCKSCLGIVGNESPAGDRWSLKGALFRRDAVSGVIENWHFIRPTGHIFYDTRMLDVNDDLPKWESMEGTSKRLDTDTRA